MEFRLIEGIIKMKYNRRDMVLIGREWANMAERVLTVRDIGYRLGH